LTHPSRRRAGFASAERALFCDLDRPPRQGLVCPQTSLSPNHARGLAFGPFAPRFLGGVVLVLRSRAGSRVGGSFAPCGRAGPPAGRLCVGVSCVRCCRFRPVPLCPRVCPCCRLRCRRCRRCRCRCLRALCPVCPVFPLVRPGWRWRRAPVVRGGAPVAALAVGLGRCRACAVCARGGLARPLLGRAPAARVWRCCCPPLAGRRVRCLGAGRVAPVVVPGVRRRVARRCPVPGLRRRWLRCPRRRPARRCAPLGGRCGCPCRVLRFALAPGQLCRPGRGCRRCRSGVRPRCCCRLRGWRRCARSFCGRPVGCRVLRRVGFVRPRPLCVCPPLRRPGRRCRRVWPWRWPGRVCVRPLPRRPVARRVPVARVCWPRVRVVGFLRARRRRGSARGCFLVRVRFVRPAPRLGVVVAVVVRPLGWRVVAVPPSPARRRRRAPAWVLACRPCPVARSFGAAAAALTAWARPPQRARARPRDAIAVCVAPRCCARAAAALAPARGGRHPPPAWCYQHRACPSALPGSCYDSRASVDEREKLA